jgi:hypothetical protein
MKNKYLLLIILLSSFLNLYAEDNLFDENALADIQSDPSPREKCNEYVRNRGFDPGEDRIIGGQKVMMICGTGSVEASPSSDKFLESRSNAFQKAIMDAKRNYSEYLAVSIAKESERKISQGEGRQNNDEEQKTQVTENDLSLFDKLSILANKEVDEKLSEKGLDPNGKDKKTTQEKEKILKKTLSESGFTSNVSKSTVKFLQGLQVNKVFESCKQGKKKCDITLAIVQSTNSRALAKALAENDPNKYLIKIPGNKIPTKFSPKQVLANVGVRLFRDEIGNYSLLSTYIVSPETDSQRSELIAFDRAKTQAQGLIRQFAGEVVESAGIDDPFESSKELPEGDFNDIQMHYNDVIKSKAEALELSGMKEISSGSIQHPANPKAKGFYSIVKWSIKDMANANSQNMRDSDGGSEQNKLGEIATEIENGFELESESSDF